MTNACTANLPRSPWSRLIFCSMAATRSVAFTTSSSALAFSSRDDVVLGEDVDLLAQTLEFVDDLLDLTALVVARGGGRSGSEDGHGQRCGDQDGGALTDGLRTTET